MTYNLKCTKITKQQQIAKQNISSGTPMFTKVQSWDTKMEFDVWLLNQKLDGRPPFYRHYGTVIYPTDPKSQLRAHSDFRCELSPLDK